MPSKCTGFQLLESSTHNDVILGFGELKSNPRGEPQIGQSCKRKTSAVIAEKRLKNEADVQSRLPDATRKEVDSNVTLSQE